MPRRRARVSLSNLERSIKYQLRVLSGLHVCGDMEGASSLGLTQQVDLALFLVVERVLRKDQHLLQDKRLSRLFPLSVSRYCQHVSSSPINLIMLGALLTTP